MKDLARLIEDEREGNIGRRAWTVGYGSTHPLDPGVAMLEGACNTIDRLLEALAEAHREAGELDKARTGEPL